MRIHICGIAGVLGSALAELFVEMGFEVQGNDVVRIEEAWRLDSVRDRIRYMWMSTTDICPRNLRGVDIVIDCGLAVADRPFGSDSPTYTMINNLMPPLRLLEALRRLQEHHNECPIAIYPSSFNACYGNLWRTSIITEDTPPIPSSVYGWTKASAELLYLTYFHAYGIPVVITRVGSAYGPRGRSDEFVHRLIIYFLKGRSFVVRSPRATRLWTYQKDVLRFYRALIEKLINDPEAWVGEVLCCAGNRGDRIIENIELAKMVRNIVGCEKCEIVEGEYEPGELVDGKPLTFVVNCRRTRRMLNWEPMYSLEDGLRETIEWFRQNLWRYT